MNLGLVRSRSFTLTAGKNISAPHLVEDAMEGRYRLYPHDGEGFLLKRSARPRASLVITRGALWPHIYGRTEEDGGRVLMHISCKPAGVFYPLVLGFALVIALYLFATLLASVKAHFVVAFGIALAVGATVIAFAYLVGFISSLLTSRYIFGRIKKLL